MRRHIIKPKLKPISSDSLFFIFFQFFAEFNSVYLDEMACLQIK